MNEIKCVEDIQQLLKSIDTSNEAHKKIISLSEEKRDYGVIKHDSNIWLGILNNYN